MMRRRWRLRGIAMAQLGDMDRARALVRRAARAFGPRETVARARCAVVEAEIALASRDLAWPTKALSVAAAVLDAHGDRANAAHARQLAVRRLLLIGRLDEAERLLAAIDLSALTPALRAVHELVLAGIAMRRVQARVAAAALGRAEEAARWARIPALAAEVEQARTLLDTPVARLIARGAERPLLLGEVEKLLASKTLVIDACRNLVRQQDRIVPLARRPVLFALARALGEAWPADVPRDVSARAAHLAPSTADESHRARLRVEIGRLRRLLQTAGAGGRDPGRFHASSRARKMSPCWPGRWKNAMPRCWPFWPMGNPGPVRRWRWPWAQASARCSARWANLRRRARSSPMAGAGPGAG